MASVAFYECGACGSNNLPEMDRRPLALCPECLAKLCWATGADPAERFRKLAALARKQGLLEESSFWDASLNALTAAKL